MTSSGIIYTNDQRRAVNSTRAKYCQNHSSELNIKLGVLTNNIRSYIDEHISNIQISTLSSSQQVQSSYSDEVSVEAMSIPEPPIQEAIHYLK